MLKAVKTTRMSVHVTFQVSVETTSCDIVCVTGSVKELGEWAPPLAFRLSRKEDSDLWTGTLDLIDCPSVEYRYMIASFGEVESEVIVKRWETNIKPRHLIVSAGCQSEVATFGEYNDRESIGYGWLISHSEIRLTLKNNPIKMWKKKYQRMKYQVKVTQIDLRHKDSSSSNLLDTEDDEEQVDSGTGGTLPSITDQQTEIAVLTCPDDYEFREQNQFGHVYNDDDIIVFRCTTFHLLFTALQVDFYSCSDEDTESVPEFKGFAYILPVNMRHLNGCRFIPITGLRHSNIGQLEVEYLVIKPTEGITFNMEVSYNQYWKRRWRPLDVGHRGMGSYYNKKRIAVARENTIASLNYAGKHGADFVEFDVQLSKDMVPVIYHDFSVFISMMRRSTKKEMLDELYEIPVKDLSVYRLQRLKMRNAQDQQVLDVDETDVEALVRRSSSATTIDDWQPFPTLEEALNRVNSHVGFNVEVKYPMRNMDGTTELDSVYFEKNEFVDRIVTVVFTHAANRRIVFSSFDPDTCIMLQLKQNKYPVMLLSQGAHGNHVGYEDVRARSPEVCIRLVKCEKLLGVCMYAGDIIRLPQLVTLSKNLGLVMFTWGVEENEEILNVKKLGVDAVIFDRINEYHTGVSQENIFFAEEKNRMQSKLQERGQLRRCSVITTLADGTVTVTPSAVGVEGATMQPMPPPEKRFSSASPATACVGESSRVNEATPASVNDSEVHPFAIAKD
ncbi:PREDICTED: glycerophosphocholine phosphodiesterase GPCPD1-like [Priapulus caudatus]|uniref:Glycerophosphocholine phosphodiesterase GPCPD1-like n=1 Tax=Priapulus caudatus TaxID=37621 RepID=A0ABM1DUE6_PRICU|nr:PREDICTED: glycerophosphocholine phosphodiesterase GPCPD1-like [Priapulus caudatus]